MEIEQTTDPDRAHEIASIPGKPYKTPFLDPSKNDFTPSNFFWMAMYSGGVPKIVGGARLDDVPKGQVAKFWERAAVRGYGEPDKGRPIVSTNPLVDLNVHGRIAYFGDLFVLDDFRGHTNRLKCFLLIAHLVAWVKWNPDCVCGFVREAAIERGIDRSYGFLNAIPRAQEWSYGPESRGGDEWLVYNRSEEFQSALSYAVDTLISPD